MDANRFDDLSRALSRAASRRGVVRAALAALAGAAIPAAARAQGTSVCREAAIGCTLDNQCCSGYCERRTSVPRNKRNRCACPGNLTACGSDCADLQTDERHCGACGVRCGDNETCCGGVCRDLNSDPKHCGACGKSCKGSEGCFGGVCKDPCVGSGSKGYVDIDGKLYTGFRDSDPWGGSCTSNEVCEANPRCSGDPNNPCICRARICQNGRTKTVYSRPQCADLDR
jgi:hypothetical protein